MGKVWKKIKQSFVSQLLLIIIFLGAGLVVSILHGLLYLFVKPVSLWYFRKLGYYLVFTLHKLLVFHITWWSENEVTLYIQSKSDEENHYGKENAFLVANHRYDLDFPFVYLSADYMHTLGTIKLIVKRAVSLIPILGWCWHFQEYLFLDRNWETDKTILGNQVKNLVSNNPYPVCVGMAPEGTRFTLEKYQVSMAVARKKGMPELKHLLLPRTKGFTLARQQMTDPKGIQAVYDITFFIDPETENQAKIVNVFRGQSAKCKIFMRRFPIEQVPLETEACAEWLHNLFREKDVILETCFSKGPMPEEFQYCTQVEKRWSSLLNFFFWAVVVLGPLMGWVVNCIVTGSYLSLNWIVLVYLAAYLVYSALTEAASVEKGSSYGQ